ncbi:CBS domain-containing protein [Methylobacterium sp. JK268]
MIARDVMTREVTGVHADASVELAVGLMLETRISGLPVLDADGAVVGIVTEGDLLARPELGTSRLKPSWVQYLIDPGRLAEAYARERGRRVGDVMTRAVATVAPGTPLDEVVELMRRLHIRRVPVVEGGRLVGIVTRADLLRALRAALQAAREVAPRSDGAIHADVEAALYEAGVLPVDRITVAVSQGDVTLSGPLADPRQRAAARAAAEAVPGVRAVHDWLTVADPLTGRVAPFAAADPRVA